MGNFYQVSLKNIENLYIASIKFEPPIQRDNRKLKKEVLDQAMPEIRAIMSNSLYYKLDEPTVCGMNILTTSEPKEQCK
jgi:hypothetical protein